MQYNISVNQKKFQDHFPALDLIDAAIYDFIRQFMAGGRIKNISHDGKQYYWISYKYIIDSLPIIGITSKRGIYKRMCRLFEHGLLEPHPENQSMAQAFFTKGEFFDVPVFDSGDDFDPTPRNAGSDPLGTRVPTPMNAGSDYPSTNPLTINPNTNHINAQFAEFWNLYDKKVDKRKSYQKFKRLTDSERKAVLDHVPKYVKATPDRQYRKNPVTYLNGRVWEDEELPVADAGNKQGKQDQDNVQKQSRLYTEL